MRCITRAAAALGAAAMVATAMPSAALAASDLSTGRSGPPSGGALVERNDTITTSPGGGRTGAPGQLTGRGALSGDVDCFVDFDDDLTIQFLPDQAEFALLNHDWNQACFDHWYPAVTVKAMHNGHFHLPYADDRIGPCAGDPSDWGRKDDPMPPVGDPAFNDWLLEPCVEDIDPVTEPRRGLIPHTAGEMAQILAYDGDGHLPFQLRRLKVTTGQVEVCHLPPGPWEAAEPGGSPFQCLTLGQGNWDLSNHVEEAVEVRIEFLENHTEIDDIGIDLL